MKYLLLICVLFIASCEENVESYNKLTPDEQAYVRDQNRIKCESNSLKNFQNMELGSNNKMANLRRNDFWKLTNPGVTDPDYLYVWNTVGTTVYFLYQQKQSTGYKMSFVKLTQDFNTEMFEYMRKITCDSINETGSNLDLSYNNSSFKYVYNDRIVPDVTTSYRNDETYTSLVDSPAWLSVFNLSTFREKLDVDGNVTTKDTIKNTIVYQTTESALELPYTRYSGAQFCIPNYTPGTPKVFAYPFTLKCAASGNPNYTAGENGDPAMDFNPATELVY